MASENWEDKNELGSALPDSDDELGSRISQVLALYSDRKTASYTAGKSVDQLLAYTKGVSSPPWMVLVKLAQGVGVSLDWLATGHGSMRHGDPVATIRPAGPQARGVPIYDAALSLGQGRLNGDAPVVGYLDLPDAYVRDVLHAPPGKVIVAYCSGDSMAPTIKDRDLVLIDTAAATFSRDDLYAFSFKDEGYIKRLQRAGDAIVVHSDNPAYTDWSVTGSDLRELRVIGRVVGIIQRP